MSFCKTLLTFCLAIFEKLRVLFFGITKLSRLFRFTAYVNITRMLKTRNTRRQVAGKGRCDKLPHVHYLDDMSLGQGAYQMHTRRLVAAPCLWWGCLVLDLTTLHCSIAHTTLFNCSSFIVFSVSYETKDFANELCSWTHLKRPC